jgi:serine phosphatase RsbU (regulator of sigma subunit)
VADATGSDQIGARDAVALLRAIKPYRLPERVIEEACARGALSAALYVIDIDGSCLMKLAGEARFGDAINLPVGVGPEIPVEAIGDVAARVGVELPGVETLAMRVRDRALGVLVTEGGDPAIMQTLADQAGLALELAGGYTDALHRARRRKAVEPAAEIQQDLLPPRIAVLEHAVLAGGVLPGYEVGGDFFDYAENEEGVWLAVGDAMGKGTAAAAMSSVAVGALRAARRNGDDLTAMALLIHETIFDLTGGDSFLTAILSLWDAEAQTLRWINCGHPRPLVVAAGGSVKELRGEPTHPLGLFGRRREFVASEHPLGSGERLLLFSDGVSERRGPEGKPIGVQWLTSLIVETTRMTAARTIREIQDAVVNVSRQPLRDDATLLMLAAH